MESEKMDAGVTSLFQDESIWLEYVVVWDLAGWQSCVFEPVGQRPAAAQAVVFHVTIYINIAKAAEKAPGAKYIASDYANDPTGSTMAKLSQEKTTTTTKMLV